MSNAIVLNDKRHVPVRAEGEYDHRCDLCSLKDEYLCDDSLEKEYHTLHCCPLCQCLGGTHFVEDCAETWGDVLLKTQGRTLYVNGECLGEVWGAFVVPQWRVYLYTQDKREHELTLEVVKKLLNGQKVIHMINTYELKGGKQ